MTKAQEMAAFVTARLDEREAASPGAMCLDDGDPGPERDAVTGLVSRVEYTLGELTHLLAAAARTPGRKDLTCAADVLDALSEAIPAAEPVPPGQPSLALLMGVDIICEPEFGVGRFRMVRHDGCDVDIATREVHHGRCPVTADGIVRLP